jgi:hypothetical protein
VSIRIWNSLPPPVRRSLLRTFAIPQGAPEGKLPDGRFVLASPLAGWGAKQWPLKSYEELAAKLDVPLVVNGAPGSASELGSIRGAHVHLSGIDGLIDATRRAHAVIGVDSGPMHLAAALGKPGVAIFGPTDPGVARPVWRIAARPARTGRGDHLQTSRRDAPEHGGDHRGCGCRGARGFARLQTNRLPRVSFPKPYADAVAKLRVPFGFILVAAFWYLAAPTWGSLAVGIPISFAGSHSVPGPRATCTRIRIWRKVGPYAYVRNPLYVGTLIVAAGFAIAARRWELGALFAAVFFLIYFPVVELENNICADCFRAMPNTRTACRN